MADAIEELHRGKKGTVPEEVENTFIEMMQSQPMYGVELFTCQVEVNEGSSSSGTEEEMCKVGLCPRGINIYHRDKARSTKYIWPTIKNLGCSKKQLMLTHIDPAARTATAVALTFASKSACKTVLKRAIELHTFFRGDLDGSAAAGTGAKKKKKKKKYGQAGGVENMAFAQQSKKRLRGKKKRMHTKELNAPQPTLLSAIKQLEPSGGRAGAGAGAGVSRFIQLTGSSGGGSRGSIQGGRGGGGGGSGGLQQLQQNLPITTALLHQRQSSCESLRHGKGPATAFEFTVGSGAGSSSGSQGAAGNSTALGEIKTVTLARAPNQIFGLTLIGPDEPSEPKGIFISEIIPGSAASYLPGLLVGGMLMSIDGVDMSSQPLRTAVAMLRASSGTVTFRIASSGTGWAYHFRKDQEKAAANNAAAVVAGSRAASRSSSPTVDSENASAAAPARSSAYFRHHEGHGAELSWVTGRIIVSDEEQAVELGPEVMVEAIIAVGDGDKLGMSITGGTDDKISENDDSVYINKLVPGGMAFKNDRLQIADRLVSLNGTSIAAMQHSDAVDLIHAALKTGVVHLVVARIVPAHEITEQQLFLGQAQSPLYCDAAAEMRYVDLPGYHREQLSFRNSKGAGAGADTSNAAFSASLSSTPLLTWESLGVTLEGPGENSPPGGGVFIAAVTPGSYAHMCGGFVAGDRLVDINGWVVDRAPLNEMQTLPSDLEVPMLEVGIVSSVLARPARRTVAIKSSAQHTGLGIQVKATKFGVFVSAVVPTGRAAADGQLRVADELMELNGVELQGLPERQVIAHLATPVLEWNFEVAHNPLRYTYYTQLEAPQARDVAKEIAALTAVVVTSPFPKGGIQQPQEGHAGKESDHAGAVDSDDDELPELPAITDAAEEDEEEEESEAAANTSDSSHSSAKTSLLEVGVAGSASNSNSSSISSSLEMSSVRTPSPRRATPVFVRPSTFAGLPCMIKTCAHFGGDAARGQLPFAYADVLEVMGVVDKQWWFAFDRFHNRYGKVPSLSALNDLGRIGALIRKDTSFQEKDSYVPVTYATAGNSAKTVQRPVLIVGAHAGTISACFARLGPEAGVAVVQPVQYTSRAQRSDEVEGKQYHFVSQAFMDAGVKEGKFVHVGRWNDALYGVSKEDVAKAATSGKVPLLEKLSAKAVERFQQQAEIAPIVIKVVEEERGDGGSGGSEAQGYDSVITETVVFKSMGETATVIVKLVLRRQEEQRTWQKDDSAFLPLMPSACGTTDPPAGAGEPASEAAAMDSGLDVFSLKAGVPLTTRAPRGGERDGIDYHFISTGEFRALSDADRLDQWGVNSGNYYGTLKTAAAAGSKPRPMLRSRTFAAALKNNTVELPPLDSAANQQLSAKLQSQTPQPPPMSLKQQRVIKRSEHTGSLCSINEDEDGGGGDGGGGGMMNSSRNSFVSSIASDSVRSSVYSNSSVDFSDCSARSGAESASIIDAMEASDDVLNRVTLARNAQGSFGFTLTEGKLCLVFVWFVFVWFLFLFIFTPFSFFVYAWNPTIAPQLYSTLTFSMCTCTRTTGTGAPWSVPCISHIRKVNIVTSILDLSEGDYIFAINDVTVAGKSHDDILDLLRSSEYVVDMLLLPNPGGYEESILQDLDSSTALGTTFGEDSEILRHPLGVVLERNGKAGFGFSIVGCERGVGDEQHQHFKPGIFISKVTEDSPAYHSGMSVGMRLLTVNGNDITVATWDAVADILLEVGDTFSMILRSECEEYERLNKTQEPSSLLDASLLGADVSGGGGSGRRSRGSNSSQLSIQNRSGRQLIWLTDTQTIMLKKKEGQMLGMRLAVEPASGARVLEVKDGGAAKHGGLVADCMIRTINGKDVAGCDYDSVRELLRPQELFLMVDFPKDQEADQDC